MVRKSLLITAAVVAASWFVFSVALKKKDEVPKSEQLPYNLAMGVSGIVGILSAGHLGVEGMGALERKGIL